MTDTNDARTFDVISGDAVAIKAALASATKTDPFFQIVGFWVDAGTGTYYVLIEYKAP